MLTKLITPNRHNESERAKNGILTFERLLDGVALVELVPKPFRCQCGNYPVIEKDGDESVGKCANTQCKISKPVHASIYPLAILSWNQQQLGSFDKRHNTLHPLTWFSFGIDKPAYLHQQITQIRQQLTEIQTSSTIDHHERRLIKVIEGWNTFGRAVVDALHANKHSEQTTKNIKKQDSLPAKPNNKTSSKQSAVPVYPIKLSGPLREYIDYVQHIGDSLYLLANGHYLRVKKCKHTQWHIPQYIVYVANKNTQPGYQVRIDLRSIGIPYYSKLHRSSDVSGSLEKCLDDLHRQLSHIPHVKKNGHLISRTKRASIKHPHQNKSVRLVYNKRDDSMRLELSLVAPNNGAGARFMARVGKPTNVDYLQYKELAQTYYRWSYLHTKLSGVRKFASGAQISFKHLDVITQHAVVSAVATQMRVPDSDIIYYLFQLNPSVKIGYLPVASLRTDCCLSSDEAPMQVVSYKQKDGYVQGSVKRHDLLKNAHCVSIDGILTSNLTSVIRTGAKSEFAFGEHKLGLCLSLQAVDHIVAENPTLELLEHANTVWKPDTLEQMINKATA